MPKKLDIFLQDNLLETDVYVVSKGVASLGNDYRVFRSFLYTGPVGKKSNFPLWELEEIPVHLPWHDKPHLIEDLDGSDFKDYPKADLIEVANSEQEAREMIYTFAREYAQKYAQEHGVDFKDLTLRGQQSGLEKTALKT